MLLLLSYPGSFMLPLLLCQSGFFAAFAIVFSSFYDIFTVILYLFMLHLLFTMHLSTFILIFRWFNTV